MSESNSRKFSKGEIDITGELDFTSATMRGHILPEIDNTVDIGSASNKIRDMYVSDNSLWVGDNNKIGASGGKKKFSKRKKGKTPKKMFDALIGPGNAFDNETALKDKFKEEIHDPAPDNTLDPGHADFHPSIKKWLEFAALHGQGQRKRPDDIFDDDDDFDSEDDIAAVEGLQAALDAKLNASLAYVLPTATDSILGGVKVGNNLTISNGVLSGVNSYTLPTASSTVLGGIKVGANLSISSGVLAGAAPYSKPSAEPISYITGLQGALNAKTTPGYVDTQVAALVDSAPATLDTLNELAEALGDDPNHVTTMTALIGTKLSLSGGAMTGNVSFADNAQIKLGSGDDLLIYHDGSNSYVKDVGVGNMYLMGENLFLDNADGTKRYVGCTASTGEVGLYYSNAEKIKTTSTGISVTGNIAVSGTVDGVDIAARDAVLTSTTTTANNALPKAGGTMTGNLNLGDGKELRFGTGPDLAVYHDGSNSYVEDQGTGDLILKGTNVALKSRNTDETFIYCSENAAVNLYYNDTNRLQTSNSGINVTGTVAATAFSGDGSSLTNLPAAGATDLNGLSDVTVSTSNPTISSNKPVGHVWVNKSSGSVYVCTDASTNNNKWMNSGDRSGAITSWAGSGGTQNSYIIGGNNYKSHIYTSSGTFTVTGSASKVIDVMVVAGGGAGGNWHSGGGGAGGMTTHSPSISGGSYSIVVGGGGAGGLTTAGTNGSNSSALSSGTILGGGRSASYEWEPPLSGGSGAGGAGTTHGHGYGAYGTSGQGNTGGNGLYFHAGGGGGGKGAGGSSATSASSAGAGGPGAANNYRTGSNIYYAGGGGGGVWSSSTSAQGGNGGGGTGSYNGNSNPPTPGTDGLGGGGGGGGHQGNSVPSSWAAAENGGDGVVIIRYIV